MKRIQILFVLALLICSCSSKPSQTSSNTSNATATPSEGITSDQVFAGSIDGKYEIRMNLRRSGRELSGSYSYNKVGKNIDLKGTIDEQNNFVIDEFDEKGNSTGVFRGRFVSDNKLEGTWSKPNGANPMPLLLEDIGNLKQSEVAANTTTQANPAPTNSNQSTSTSSSGYNLSQSEMLSIMQTKGIWNMYSGLRRYPPDHIEILRVGQFNQEKKYWPVQIRLKERGMGEWVITVYDVRIFKNDYGDWEARRIG